jgi:SAM-dependent methyltransferase
LVASGFVCKLDQFAHAPPEGWPEWSRRQLADADFILVVCTPGYTKEPERSNNYGQGQGRGRIWEWNLIQQHLYDNYCVSSKVIPVVFGLDGSSHVPDYLRGHPTYRVDTPAGYTELLERLVRISWEKYEGLFNVGDYRIAFVPFLNPSGKIITRFPMRSVKIVRSASRYVLPDEFKSTVIERPFDDLAACRLVHYKLTPPSRIELALSEIKYSDYLKSGEHLDDPLPSNRNRTFRQEFARLIPGGFDQFQLTSICGVGLFVVTRDRHVLVCRHSAKSHVYPLRWTFSASGTMRWGAWPHPFTEVIWKCRQEINHQVNLDKLELIEIGADARKLYFECCFVERTELSSAELEANLPDGLEYEMLQLYSADEFISRILNGCWEPAAEAVLLMLSLKVLGTEPTLHALQAIRTKWKQHQMLDEWDIRASRNGALAVMSVRYPPEKLKDSSSKYVNHVVGFMGDDIKGKRVLEIGSGIGRITRRLVQACEHVTCVDLCDRMNQRNREQLGTSAKKTQIKTCFIQEFRRGKKKKYDCAICSLVLIHNVDQEDFVAAISVTCEWADVVFIFEDVTRGRGTSPHTRLCSVEKLQEEFRKCGFVTERQSHHSLFGDQIAFVKFVRDKEEARSRV